MFTLSDPEKVAIFEVLIRTVTREVEVAIYGSGFFLCSGWYPRTHSTNGRGSTESSIS